MQKHFLPAAGSDSCVGKLGAELLLKKLKI